MACGCALTETPALAMALSQPSLHVPSMMQAGGKSGSWFSLSDPQHQPGSVRACGQLCALPPCCQCAAWPAGQHRAQLLYSYRAQQHRCRLTALRLHHAGRWLHLQSLHIYFTCIVQLDAVCHSARRVSGLSVAASLAGICTCCHALQGGACSSEPATFAAGNVAHSSRVGFWLAEAGGSCTALGNLTAHHTTEVMMPLPRRSVHRTASYLRCPSDVTLALLQSIARGSIIAFSNQFVI